MSENKGFLHQVISGTLLTVAAALFFSVAFSLVASACSLSSSVIRPVNQFIKTIAVFFGCFFRLRGKAGIFKGLLTGGLSEVILLLVFTLFYGTAIDIYSAADILFCAVLGGIFGVVSVNVRKDG